MPTISSPTPDATTLSKGKIQLAGDLTGTAALPTLSTSAIKLGYAPITTNFATTSTTAVQVTGLTQTVTVPAGGRSVKITVYAWAMTYNSTGGIQLSLWDGTVGSGTQLTKCDIQGGATMDNGATMIAVVTPSSGSKTYNVGLLGGGGTATLNASSVGPAFILVELI